MASSNATNGSAAEASSTAAATSTKPTVDTVVVHPLVLLSVTDHYNRVAKDTRKRVVGVLLGETFKGRGGFCDAPGYGTTAKRTSAKL